MPIGLLITMCVGWGQPSLASLQEREIEFQGRMYKQFVHRYTPPPRYTPLNLLQGSESICWNTKLHSLKAKAVQDFYNQLPDPRDQKTVQAWMLQRYPLGSSVELLEVSLLLNGFSSSRTIPAKNPEMWKNRIQISMDAHFPRTSAIGGSETYVCTLMVRHDDQGRVTELTVTRASRTEVGPLIILRP